MTLYDCIISTYIILFNLQKILCKVPEILKKKIYKV